MHVSYNHERIQIQASAVCLMFSIVKLKKLRSSAQTDYVYVGVISDIISVLFIWHNFIHFGMKIVSLPKIFSRLVPNTLLVVDIFKESPLFLKNVLICTGAFYERSM